MGKSESNNQANQPSEADPQDQDQDPWDTALIIGQTIGPVFPLDGKGPAAGFGSWPSKAKRTVAGIQEFKKAWAGCNYGVVLGEDAFSLDIDVDGLEALKAELKQLRDPDILGEFKLGFVVITGSNHYHAYFNQRGYKARNQQLTTHTYLRGFPNYYMVGPGSIHPDTSLPYHYCDTEGLGDPRHLGWLSDETLKRLSEDRISVEPDESHIFFDLGDGEDVLLLNHPPCIRKLMLRGAPLDDQYADSNHTIARYAISAGLTDGDAVDIAEEMARHTSPDHPTHKGVEDRVTNFRTHLRSSRERDNYWKCSYIWGSGELVSNGLCNKCQYVKATTQPATTEKARTEALRIMRSGDPMSMILMPEYSTVHKSDKVNGEYGFLQKSIASVLNSDGLQQEGSGGSGKGKSSSDKAVNHHLPPEDVLDTAFSNKALYRQELHRGMVVCIDDAQISDDLEVVIRRSMSHFQESVTYHSLDSKNDPVVYEIPPGIIWKINQIDNSLDLQTENRMVRTSVDESEEADEATYQLQIARDKVGSDDYPITFNTLVCHEIFRILNEVGPFRVDIPWVDKLNWPKSRKSDRRGYPIFRDIIKAYAALRCLCRREISTGHILAEREDFNSALKLYTALGDSPATKLNAREQRVVKAIQDLQERKSKVTLKNLLPLINDAAPEKYAAIAEHELRRILDGREGKGGLLGKINGLTADMQTVSVTKSTSKGGGFVSESQNVKAKVYSLSDYNVLASFDITDISLPDDAGTVDHSLPLFTDSLPPTWSTVTDDAESLKSADDDHIEHIDNNNNHSLPYDQGYGHPPGPLPLGSELEGEKDRGRGGVHAGSGQLVKSAPSYFEEAHTEELEQIGGLTDLLTVDHEGGQQVVNSGALLTISPANQFSLGNDEYKTAPKKKKQPKAQRPKDTTFQKRIEPITLPDIATYLDSHTFKVDSEVVRLGSTVGCDIETTGLLPQRDRIRLITVTDGKHTLTTEAPGVFALLLADDTITKVFHAANFDISFLESLGYPVVNYQDTMLMVQVLDYRQHHGLEEAAKKYLHIKLDKSLQGAEYWQDELTEGHVLYNQQDAAATLRLYDYLTAELGTQKLELYRRELAQVPVVVRLHNDGIPFDVKKAQSVISELKTKRDDLEAQIRADLSAPTVNLNSPDQIINAFSQIGIELPSTNKKVLAWHDQHLEVKKLIEYKSLKKIVQDFETEYAPHVTPDGRLHASYWIIGSPVSRFSCSGPNLQKVPKALHDYFISQNSEAFTNGDISMAQVRVLAQWSQDPNLIDDLKNGVDIFRKIAKEIFDTEDPTEEQRNIVKTTVYARFYNSTPSPGSIRGRIKRETGKVISKSEAAEIADKVLDPYPVAREWLNDQLTADSLCSFWGRSWELPEDDNRRLNYSIQSGEAECLKEALLLLYPRLKPEWKLVNVVHDSVMIQSSKEDVDEVKQVLRECLTEGMGKLITSVPVAVSVNSGASWKLAEGK